MADQADNFEPAAPGKGAHKRGGKRNKFNVYARKIPWNKRKI